jgi:hypothetical protein
MNRPTDILRHEHVLIWRARGSLETGAAWLAAGRPLPAGTEELEHETIPGQGAG